MTLSTNFKALVLALSAFGAMQAQADVVANAPSTGNSNLMFFAFDSSGKSWVQGLSMQMDTAIGLPTSTQTFSLTGLAAFFTGSTDAQWGVTAADSLSAGTFAGYRILSTAPLATVGTDFAATNLGVKNLTGNMTTFLNNAGQGNPALVAGTPVTTTSPLDIAYSGGTTWGSIWGNGNAITPADTTPLAGGPNLATWVLDTQNAISGTARPATNTTLNRGTAFRIGDFNLTGDTLTYAPSAVPVPAAVWLLGSALVGVTGIRRRS